MKELTAQQKATFKVLAIVFIFVGGTLFGTTLSKTPQKVVERVEVEKNGEAWRELKAIDDEAMKLGKEHSELCAASFYAIESGDSGTLKAINDKTGEVNQRYNIVVEARQRVLKSLGY